MRRCAVSRALQGVFVPRYLNRSGVPALPVLREPMCLLDWRYSGRLSSGVHCRRFAQKAGANSEPSEQSEATKHKATASGEDREAQAEKPASDADSKEEPAKDGKAEAKDEEPEAGASGNKESDHASASTEETAKAEENAAPEQKLSPEEKLQQELDELTEKTKKKKKELLLALADFENNKKKFTKAREGRRRNATEKFARTLVGVYSEFEDLPALKIGHENTREGSPCVALQEGVALTRDLFASAMEKSNVERLPVELGQPVVAARHEVVGSTVGDGSFPTKSIGEVTEAGWIMDLRNPSPVVLRKAKVKTVGHGAEDTSS